MMRNKKWLALSGVALLATAACSTGDDSSSSEGSSSSDTKKEITMVSATDLPQLDPTLTTDSTSVIVTNNVFEGLYRLDENNQPTPGIAEDVEISEDGLTYTFKLRDANWSDGSPITAEDFVYSWKRALNPETGAEYAYILQDLKNANKILAGEMSLDDLGAEAIDEKTLEVQLEAPAPYFLGLTGFPTYMPQKQEYVEEQGEEFATSVDKTLYNGPYVLSEWQDNAGWVYKKNPEYWDAENVKMDTINVKVVKDVSTGVNLFESGEADYTLLSSEFVPQFEDSDEFKTRADARINFLRFNQKNEALQNVNIREALAKGFDKQSVTDVILTDGSQPANYIVAKDFTFTEDGADFREKYPDLLNYNVDEAKAAWEKD